MNHIYKSVDSNKVVDLTKVDSIRREQDTNASYIFFFQFVDFGDRAGPVLMDSWTYATPLERDIEFERIRRWYLGGNVKFG